MTYEETKKIFYRCKLHRTFFCYKLSDSEVYDLLGEWFHILKEYDYKVVDENLTKLLSSSPDWKPDVFDLVKDIPNINQMKRIGEFIKGNVRCQFCMKELPHKGFRVHEDRCRSIKYLKKLSSKYFYKEITDEDKYFNLSEEEFYKKYINVLQRVLPRMKEEGNQFEARGLENTIDTFYGRQPKYKLEEI